MAPGSPFTTIGARATFRPLRNARRVFATRSLPAMPWRGAPRTPPVSVHPVTSGSKSFVSGARGAKLIETEAGHHHHQPSANVVDLVEVGSQQPSERLLDHVLGVVDAAEHPVGHVEQHAAMLAPHPDEPIV
jgi:hypothetical protein